MGGVGYLVLRTFPEVQTAATRGCLIKGFDTMDFGTVRHDAYDAGIVLQIKGNRLTGAGNFGPAALCARARLGVPFGVGIGLCYCPRPVFINLPGILYAGYTRQKAGQRVFAFGGALEFSQADEYALCPRCREVIDETLMPQSPEHPEQAPQSGQAAKDNR